MGLGLVTPRDQRKAARDQLRGSRDDTAEGLSASSARRTPRQQPTPKPKTTSRVRKAAQAVVSAGISALSAAFGGVDSGSEANTRRSSSRKVVTPSRFRHEVSPIKSPHLRGHSDGDKAPPEGASDAGLTGSDDEPGTSDVSVVSERPGKLKTGNEVRSSLSTGQGRLQSGNTPKKAAKVGEPLSAKPTSVRMKKGRRYVHLPPCSIMSRTQIACVACGVTPNLMARYCRAMTCANTLWHAVTPTVRNPRESRLCLIQSQLTLKMMISQAITSQSHHALVVHP